MIEFNNEEEFINFINQENLAFVMFSSTWCPPCKMLKPIVYELSDNYPDFPMALLNTDIVKDVAKKNGIYNVPTICFYKNGNVIDTIDGYTSYEELVDKLNELTA